MKSIKPGRGPSGMSFIGSLAAIIFGIFWTIIAASITAHSPFGILGNIFPLFGIIFIIIGIVQAVYHYNNTTSKDRFSLFDITDKNEEGDPSNKWIKSELCNMDSMNNEKHEDTNKNIAYCPYCGKSLDNDFSFCPKCGKNVK